MTTLKSHKQIALPELDLSRKTSKVYFLHVKNILLYQENKRHKTVNSDFKNVLPDRSSKQIVVSVCCLQM